MSPPPPPPIVPPIFLFGPPTLPDQPSPEPAPIESRATTGPAVQAPAPAPQPQPAAPAPAPAPTPDTSTEAPPSTSFWDEEADANPPPVPMDESDMPPPRNQDGEEAAMSAAAASILAPGTRRFFLGMGAGRSFKLRTKDNGGEQGFYGGGLGYYSAITNNSALRLEEVVGAHFGPAVSSGGYAALVFQQTLRTLNDYTFGVRVGGDIQVTPNHGFYLSPSALAGFNLLREVYFDQSWDYYDYDGPSNQREVLKYNRASFQFSLAAKMLLGDRLYFHFRPVDLDIVTNFDEYEVRWNLTGGFGITM